MKRCLPILVILAMVATANAAISETFNNAGPETVSFGVYDPIQGFVVFTDITLVSNKMTVDTEQEFMTASLIINLTAGSVVNASPINTEPHPLGQPYAFYDTYFASPENVYLNHAKFAEETIGATSITVDWYVDQNLADYIPGAGVNQLIASIGLSPDAQGTITGTVADFDLAFAGTPQAISTSWTIIDGAIVPEPVTMTLLAIGGIGVLLRKKR